ncbi:ubiquitin-associated protein 2-like isoform X4 [Sinocyclocheilus grahami]|uniref:Ubiquitin-associated protein 2-like n=1 Tax=Sinocyclocheilus grahami TaxID=75366 RepID=A0A672P8Y1_SINGR|nr:PREDICTED: ubiquitin-associated protein 2-like isoform X4 [Sinocyclocheilus grahami]
MMTSVGGSRTRGNWEQTQGQTQSQSQHKQRPQATAEQIRLAQMISDHNDADFEEKVKQLVDITGKDQDESMIALHDCNGDVNRAINVLLEGSPDTDSWEMVGKKKGVSGQKESAQTDGGDEGKENREKGGERDVARRRGGAPRRGRGASRGREFRGQENGLDGAKASGVAGRGMERGRRGRGRGRGGAGRRGGRFSAQGMGQIDKSPRYDLSGDESTFNPADYTEPAQTEESYTSGSTWSNTGNLEPEDGNRLEFTGGEGTNYPRQFDSAPGAWRTATEEWGMEDWNEDLSETKIFTASSVASMPIPQENVTITAGQRIDLAVLLGKTPPSSSSEAEPALLEGPQPPSRSQSLVFSNSKQTASQSQSSSSAPYSQHSMVSMLGKGFGDVGDPKGTTGGSTTGSQFLEQFKTAQALAHLVAQHSQSGTPNAGPSTWDTSPTTLGQYDMKPQTEPVHSPFTKRQPYQPTSTSMDAFLQDKATPASTTSALPPQSTPSSSSSLPQAITTPVPKPSGPTLGQQNSSSPADPQASSPLPLQQHKLKQQKKRASITTKIPALAVEMPGSADISGLNLQFGALQFGSEPVLSEYDASAAVATTTPGNQGQNSLYTSASNEQATALSNPSQMELYEPRASQTRRYPPSVSSSPQKDIQSKNGFNSMQTSQSLEAAAGSAVPVKPVSESVVPPSVSNISSLADRSSGPPSLLTTSSQTPLSALGHEDASPSSLAPPQHNSLPLQQNSLAPSSVRTSNTSLLHPSVDGDSCLHSSSFSSVSVVAPPSVPPPSSATSAAPVSYSCPIPPSSSVSLVSAQSALGPVSSLTMGLNSGAGVVSMPPPLASASSSSSAALATVAPSSASSRSTAASGKAPPNLPPGVPPLLPNPYIMAPGLLHPYPPQVYGYDDLQMLQTRIPLDYYSIPFATPATALTGRDGSLTSNPYSAGDLSKFGRGDASSPAPTTTLAQPQQTQTQAHHTTQQPFLNPTLPPGYSYTSLPYYTGVPGLPNTFQYGPAMFPVAPTSSKQHGVNVGVNASATPFQQASGYGSHGYSTGVSVTSSNTGVPDISGSVYTKTQSFEKQGFHTGAPSASFSLPSALGSGGPINPTAAAGYAPAPYMHILTPHQQPHSQMLHHHLQQDGQSGSGQRSQNASIQQKSQINKSGYNSYNWGGN